ncbi:nuclear autoantigenic sperm protein isoform X2 [Mucor ambiguus]|uniref:Nuclear autoantigenic sperm protein isoform X2 n=1 Tax=Mucor ambiguus TaxID=91626 RepID=A0A0C9MID7_9FUNG|nr:nuclear autoantigenic sperm protein isoform X2 [Mucor ambiguus]
MSEQQSSSEAKAQELFDQGKLAFNKGEYESSVTKDQLNGDLATANGDAYFLYGQALLQFAIQQNTVLGQSAQASATKVEEQQAIAKDEEVESKNPLFQLSGVPEFKEGGEEGDDNDEDEDDDEEGEAGNTADEDFETAWDILDVARLIFEKGEDNKSKLNLADVHLCLGDVSLETEKFNEALSDYEKAIEIKQSVLEDDNRELAEAHYKYALALEFSTEKADQALPELQKAVDVLKKRISNLEAGGDGSKGKGKGKASDIDERALEEIKEINELIPDMELKIEELATRQATEKEAEAMLKAMLGFTKASTELTASTPVNDLSTLVKRKPANDVSNLVKRKADQVATKEGEKEGEDQVKKSKLD